MRKAGILVLMLLVIFGGVYGWREGWFDEYLKDQGMPSQTADGVPAAKDTVVRPTFDIVRAEPTGDIVMAGRAESGWTVTVESNGNVIGTVVADAMANGSCSRTSLWPRANMRSNSRRKIRKQLALFSPNSA